MDEYVIKDGKKLRMGYTTGSCAAAAAKAAAWMLLCGRRREMIGILTPGGIRLDLPVEEITMAPGHVSCAVRKDAGDDPDVTHRALIFADVSYYSENSDIEASDSVVSGTEVSVKAPSRILIDGGEGVGRVTKPGLDQPVGAAAINSVPRQMIREHVEEVCRLADYTGGLKIVISVPEGQALAKKTFNSRLGIIGGISILGTTGIVEPMSEQALVETIRVELSQRRAQGAESILLTPGNYGADYIRGTLGLDPESAVKTSNFIGDTLSMCGELGFKGILLVGHIGKLVKLAGNMMNTHSRYGDCRMEILAAYGGACGLSSDGIREILGSVAADEAIRVLDEAGIREAVMAMLTERICFMMAQKAGEGAEVGIIVFSNVYGGLCKSSNAGSLLAQIQGG